MKKIKFLKETEKGLKVIEITFIGDERKLEQAIHQYLERHPDTRLL